MAMMNLRFVYDKRRIFMVKTLLVAITATMLLVSSTPPSSADYYRRGGGYGYGGGGGWHGGGGWNGGEGAALGLGLGLGLLGGALATAPYYAAPYYASPGYGYGPAPVATTWYWCDPYQQYYPYVPSCPTAWRQVVQ
jgi:hypothetical protein